jgi:hypothetical protein
MTDTASAKRISDAEQRMAYLEEYIHRKKIYSAVQMVLSCNSPSWIRYHNALVNCIEELKRFDLARSDST